MYTVAPRYDSGAVAGSSGAVGCSRHLAGATLLPGDVLIILQGSCLQLSKCPNTLYTLYTLYLFLNLLCILVYS